MKISVLLAALLLLFSCTDKDSKQSQDLIVKAAQAVSPSGIKTTEFPFIAQPFRTSELSFRVGGLLIVWMYMPVTITNKAVLLLK